MGLGFDTALSALAAARTALQTIGHNIANANTLGYSRQRVLLSPYAPQALRPGVFVGNGVNIDAVDQIYDPLIMGRLRTQTHEVGRAETQFGVLRDLESAFGEPSDNGLNARLSGFFGALGALQPSPSDGALRSSVLQSAVGLAQTFRTIRGDVAEVAQSVDTAIGYEATRVNRTLEDIYELNRAIVRNGFGTSLPPDIRDHQNVLLNQLAQSVDIRVTTEPTGQISVTSSGQLLVNANGVNPITVTPRQLTGEGIKLRAGGSTVDFRPKGGRLSALLDSAPKTAADGVKALDDLAHALIREINHAHATGVPASGGYTSVVGIHSFEDHDGDGTVLGEKIGGAGLPFEVKDGLLTISVQDQAGNIRQTRVGILANQTTVGDILQVINSIDHVSASIDSTGRFRIDADQGYKFDFSSRLNPNPDAAGTFSGEKPTIIGPFPFPTAIPPGLQFQLRVDGGPPQTLTFLASHFANPAQATAEEMAAAINGQATGAHASVVSGRLVLQGNTSGSSGTLQLNGGPIFTGTDQPVKVSVSGTYTGAHDQSYILAPTSDGIVGQTPGLQVQVSTPDGTVIGLLDVGLGYTPGDPIEIANGIEVSFTAGPLSKTAEHFVPIEAIAEGDQTDFLVASGINAVFDGFDASTIEVRQKLLDSPELFAAGLGGGVSDGSNLGRLLAAKTTSIASLGARSLGERFGLLVQETGASTERARNTFDTQQVVLDQLEARRQSVSGVNLDEELLLMEQFQRSYEVAARYTQTLSTVNDVLMSLLG